MSVFPPVSRFGSMVSVVTAVLPALNVLTKSIYLSIVDDMDTGVELNGAAFIWDEKKARLNVGRHGGITFRDAAEAFFDPLFRLTDASRSGENRDAVIGYDSHGRLLYVVHVVLEDEAVRIVSARKATKQERNEYDS